MLVSIACFCCRASASASAASLARSSSSSVSSRCAPSFSSNSAVNLCLFLISSRSSCSAAVALRSSSSSACALARSCSSASFSSRMRPSSLARSATVASSRSSRSPLAIRLTLACMPATLSSAPCSFASSSSCICLHFASTWRPAQTQSSCFSTMRRLAVSRRISTAPACASRMAASPDKPLLNALGTDQSKFHKRSDRAFAPGSSDLIVASGFGDSSCPTMPSPSEAVLSSEVDAVSADGYLPSPSFLAFRVFFATFDTIPTWGSTVIAVFCKLATKLEKFAVTETFSS
mmetsp:Transcript_37957/g.89485  ORF Transcript_37957/g.89485 Transcript_37957/m.89485 type:complete len:290 (+) Transcript_37957:922-1791(+)